MAWSFSGTGKITLPALAIDQDTMTAYAWAKGPGTANDSIFDVSNRLTLWWNGTALTIDVGTGAGSGSYSITEAGTGLTVANWNHYAFTFDDSAAPPILYLNGETATLTEDDAAGEFTNTSANFYIGNFGSGSGPHEGPIAHVGIHNVVLTQNEIRRAYRRGVCWRGILRYHPMVDPTVVADHSGNVQNATSTTGATHTTDHPPILGPWYVPKEWSEPLGAAPAAPPAGGPSFLPLMGVG